MVKKKKTPKPPVSAVLPPSDLLLLLGGQLQGSVRVRAIKVSTNQWHTYGSVHLAIFDHLWVFGIVSGLNSVERTRTVKKQKEEVEEFQKREKKGAMITLILSLLTLFLICETWQFRQNITLKNY